MELPLSALLPLYEAAITYHWRVEFVKLLPLGLLLAHYIDFIVLERTAIPHLRQNIFGLRAEATIRAREKRQTKRLSPKDCRRPHLSGQLESVFVS